MDYGSCVILEAPPPIISTFRSLKKWNERKLNPLIRNSEPFKAWPWNKLKPFCTEQLDSQILICKYPKELEEGRFLGAELLMFIALFKKNKKLLNPGIELMLHNVLL
ncbi:hypothetical protein AAG906_033338 [Vitis piasezkii]